MSLEEREKRWMAYMDGQMSTSEALEFERSLTARDQERIGGEVKLESALCESLMGRACCPVALWNSLAEKMKKPTPVVSRKVYWASRALSVLAATGLVVFGATLYTESGRESNQAAAESLRISETSVEKFASESEVPPTLQAAQKFLDDNNIELELVRIASAPGVHSHKIEFLGACRSKCKEKSLIELRFSCCGQPAALLVARKGSAGANMIRRASHCGDIRDVQDQGDYVTAVTCGHDTAGLLELLQPRRTNLI